MKLRLAKASQLSLSWGLAWLSLAKFNYLLFKKQPNGCLLSHYTFILSVANERKKDRHGKFAICTTNQQKIRIVIIDDSSFYSVNLLI